MDNVGFNTEALNPAGIVVARSWSVNEFGLYDADSTEIRSVAASASTSFSSWVGPEVNDTGTVTVTTMRNQLDVPVHPQGLVTDHRNSGSITINDDGTYDASFTSSPVREPTDEDPDDPLSGFYYKGAHIIRVRGEKSTGGFFRYATEGIHHYVRYYGSEEGARNIGESEGWDNRVTFVQGQWRSDMVVGRKMQNKKLAPGIDGLGSPAFSWPA
jgi:hypothetical protein